jgi:hypothetical protein
MTQLPVERQTIDMATGKVTATDTVHFNIMPAPAGTCPECAVKHDADMPHNATSLSYQYRFYAQHGRWPNWVDAMEHCTEDMRASWTDALVKQGVDVAGGKLRP